MNNTTEKTTTRSRYYSVTHKATGKNLLVKASSKQQAFQYMGAKDYDVSVASLESVVEEGTKGKLAVEDARAFFDGAAETAVSSGE